MAKTHQIDIIEDDAPGGPYRGFRVTDPQGGFEITGNRDEFPVIEYDREKFRLEPVPYREGEPRRAGEWERFRVRRREK